MANKKMAVLLVEGQGDWKTLTTQLANFELSEDLKSVSWLVIQSTDN
jgi:hypothetical protein